MIIGRIIFGNRILDYAKICNLTESLTRAKTHTIYHKSTRASDGRLPPT